MRQFSSGWHSIVSDDGARQVCLQAGGGGILPAVDLGFQPDGKKLAPAQVA